LKWKPDKNRPITPQLCEHICVRIASGKYTEGQKLPSVRDLALSIGVNPNTVQRSYESLEQQGIIYTLRNLGSFVSKDVSIAKAKVNELAKLKTEEYLQGMESLGFELDATKKYIEEWNV